MGRVDDVEVVAARRGTTGTGSSLSGELAGERLGRGVGAVGEQRRAGRQVELDLGRVERCACAELDEGTRAAPRRGSASARSRTSLRSLTTRPPRRNLADRVSDHAGPLHRRRGRRPRAARAARRRCRRCASATRRTWSIVNGENSAGGMGITEKTANDLFDAGADVITTGNHVYRHREVYDFLDRERPRDPAGQLPARATPAAATPWSRPAGCGSAVINLSGAVGLQGRPLALPRGRRHPREDRGRLRRSSTSTPR